MRVYPLLPSTASPSRIRYFWMVYRPGGTFSNQVGTKIFGRGRDVVRLIEQCCFNGAPDFLNGQTFNFILKSPNIDCLGVERFWNTIETILFYYSDNIDS